MINTPSKTITPTGYRENWRSESDQEDFILAALEDPETPEFRVDDQNTWLEVTETEDRVETTVFYDNTQITHSDYGRDIRANDVEFLYRGKPDRNVMARKEHYHDATGPNNLD